MAASCALNSFPGGDAFFAGFTDNKGSITIDGVSLCHGEWDTAVIGYNGTVVSLSGRDESVSLHNNKVFGKSLTIKSEARWLARLPNATIFGRRSTSFHFSPGNCFR
jgi:hypothetical protein